MQLTTTIRFTYAPLTSVVPVQVPSSLLRGSISGSATCGAVIIAKGFLFGTLSGNAQATGNLTYLAGGSLSASLSATASVSAGIRAKGQAVGAASGSTVVTGTLSFLAAGGMSATSAGATTASATLRATGFAAGSSSSTATSGAAIRGKGEMAASVAGATTTTGVMRSAAALSANVTATSATTATLQAKAVMAGSSSGAATSSATATFIDERGVMKFSTLPFGVRTSGSTMELVYSFNEATLETSPKLVCLGSSTMEGYGLTAPNRYADRIQARLNSETTSAQALSNLALGGQNSVPLRPLSSGGTSGRSIDDALALNPSFVLVDEPTNWAGSYTPETQATYWKEIFNYAYARGVIVLFNGPRPRHGSGFGTTQQQRLVDFYEICNTDPLLKLIVNNNFYTFHKSGTIAELSATYDSGDGVHMNAAGQVALEASSWAFWQSFFINSGYDQFVIENSADNASFATFDTITDLSLYKKSYSKQSGYFRAKARKADATYSPVSTVTQVTNTAPSVNAGTDQNLAEGTTSATLTGTASDTDGSIASYAWTRISGPNTPTIVSPSAASTSVTGMIAGTYVFRLTVTDNLGAIATDDISVTIAAAASPVVVAQFNFGPTGTAAVSDWVNVLGDPRNALLTGTDSRSGSTIGVSTRATGDLIWKWNGVAASGNGTGSNATYAFNQAVAQTWFFNQDNDYNASLAGISDGVAGNHNLLITGLDPAKTYKIEIQSNRAGATDTRTTNLRVIDNVETSLQTVQSASAQSWSTARTWTGRVPKSNGEIWVAVHRGTGSSQPYGYINAIRITQE